VTRALPLRLPTLLSLTLPSLCLLVACGPPREEPTASDVAAYFGLVDGSERVYVGPSSQEETHSYALVPGVGEGLVFDRTARRGGFVQDDLTQRFVVTLEGGLQMTRFLDCLTRCAEAATPLDVLPWPVEGGESVQSEAEVEVTENGETVETRTERHRFQVGSEEDVTVPAGSFPAFRVIWTRTIAEESTSSQFVIAPDEGIIVSEGFDGSSFELTEVR
jgi:hypothetical protein